mmetsp:Transcript_32918/g.104792  ORF Transcript_32918/g.104792 Transcript_32918/m.104792 type:complete len:210 (-) Transcript_32918:81-710(-)
MGGRPALARWPSSGLVSFFSVTTLYPICRTPHARQAPVHAQHEPARCSKHCKAAAHGREQGSAGAGGGSDALRASHLHGAVAVGLGGLDHGDDVALLHGNDGHRDSEALGVENLGHAGLVAEDADAGLLGAGLGNHADGGEGRGGGLGLEARGGVAHGALNPHAGERLEDGAARGGGGRHAGGGGGHGGTHSDGRHCVLQRSYGPQSLA